jgi:hypothetical protein
MIHKPFEQVSREDIDGLVANDVKEGRTIEYKAALPTNADKDKKDFLGDVSSFANAAGGDLLYGVVAKRDADNKTTGIPEAVPGLAGLNSDQEILRLDSMIQAGIGPRIAGIRIRTVDGFPDGPVLLVRIPKSYASPHMVTFQEHSRFYSRNNAGKYPLDVSEIRSAFALSESLPERIRRFRDERLARIVAGEVPIAVGPGPWTVLHLIPLAALDPTTRIDVTPFERRGISPTHPSSSTDSRFNFDGLVFYTVRSPPGTSPAYVQLFRHGAIEAVDAAMLAGGEPKLIRIADWESILIEKLGSYLPVQRDMGLAPPIFVLLSLLGVRGYNVPHGAFRDSKPSIDRDVLLLPDLLVEDYAVDSAATLLPAFDALWQAGGWPRCMNRDAEGRWTDKSRVLY